MDVVVLDGAGADPPRRRRGALSAEMILLLNDDSDEEVQVQPAQKRKKKRASDAGDKAQENDEPGPVRKKREKKEPPEKRVDQSGRTVRFSAQPSQATYDRIQRALPGSAHRMFLIQTKEVAPAGAAGGRSQDFDVLGATGNVYTVSISRHPHCTCPDFGKGHVCKHILFVMLRVLKLSTNNPLVWQKALLTKEVEEVLGGQHSQGVQHLASVLAPEAVRNTFRRMAGTAEPGEEEEEEEAEGNRRPVEGDCPICFDELKEGSEAIVWCHSCGNNIHGSCFQRWVQNKKRTGAAVTCVLCRAPWEEEGNPGEAGGASGSGSGYMNLAQYSEAHRNSDTSLYALYGDRAMWIEGGGGAGGRARTWQQLHGRRRR